MSAGRRGARAGEGVARLAPALRGEIDDSVAAAAALDDERQHVVDPVERRPVDLRRRDADRVLAVRERRDERHLDRAPLAGLERADRRAEEDRVRRVDGLTAVPDDEADLRLA